MRGIVCNETDTLPFLTPRVNMEEIGILDLWEKLDKRHAYGSSDLWLDYIERYAPGYIDLEEDGDGMAYWYDHSRFRNNMQLSQLPFDDFDS